MAKKEKPKSKAQDETEFFIRKVLSTPKPTKKDEKDNKKTSRTSDTRSSQGGAKEGCRNNQK